MKRTILSCLLLLCAICGWAQTSTKLDSTQFVAFYNYTINTQDENGQSVSDSLRLALLVGSQATYCTTVLSYNRNGGVGKEMLNTFLMHHQNMTTDLKKNEVIAVEPLYPYRFESHEPLVGANWKLTDDTLTICGLPCHRATGELYGKKWTVWYTEDIPSSAGPWKLRGLPGLIVKAEDDLGIHCFEMYETKNVVKDITFVSNPQYHKYDRKKLMKYKKQTLGNPRYVNEPTYYVPEYADDVGGTTINGFTYYIGMTSHMMVLQKAHKYQPLELK